MTTTVIRGADVAVAWDETSKSHNYLQDADVAFDGGRITYFEAD